MARFALGLFSLWVLLSSSGCRMCIEPQLGVYPARGGILPRADLLHGRVGSAFSPAEAAGAQPAPAKPAPAQPTPAPAELTTAPLAVEVQTAEKPRRASYWDGFEITAPASRQGASFVSQSRKRLPVSVLLREQEEEALVRPATLGRLP